MSASPPPPYEEFSNHPGRHPPALPPRPPSGVYSQRPGPAVHAKGGHAMASHDPRSSSTQSLVPDQANEDTGRRRLLLIYVHGFMGNETSFQSFPAHVHNLVTITLADSHTVHTKIYPRYKSRDSLELRRDDFSNWLTPHETPLTDIILVGHSMGGLLAAEISLTLRHHIIGAINFDVPFLGMHPGIVKAGLGSIFNPAPPPQHQPTGGDPSTGKRPSRMDTLFNARPNDPNYNPSFYNDVNIPVRKGWENALHFMNKHSNGLMQASKGLVKSHFEFGSAMADYRGLKDRYARIRALEEDDERKRQVANPGVRSPPRIRFVNYYTQSTGRPKKPKSASRSPSPSRPSSRTSQHAGNSTAALAAESQLTLSTIRSEATTASPRISVEEYRDGKIIPVSPEEPLSEISPTPTNDSVGPIPTPEKQSAPDLPEIPPIPQEPPFVDLALYSEKAERRAAEKEHGKALKEYQRAVKARNNVIKERSKIQEKWEKQKRKESEAAKKAEREAAKKEAQEAVKQQDKEDEEAAKKAHDDHDLRSSMGAIAIEAEQHPQNNGNYPDQPLQSREQHHHGSGENSRVNEPTGSYDFSYGAILAHESPDSNSLRSNSTAPSTLNHSSFADSTTTLTTQDTNTSTQSSNSPPKPKKFKKFCMLPPKDANGNKDPTWVSVFMENMDEVTAHCGLFFVSETYEMLVGDVAARIEEWVSEAESLRVVRDMERWE